MAILKLKPSDILQMQRINSKNIIFLCWEENKWTHLEAVNFINGKVYALNTGQETNIHKFATHWTKIWD